MRRCPIPLTKVVDMQLSSVLRDGPKVKPLTNLGWLLRNWQLVESFDCYPHPPKVKWLLIGDKVVNHRSTMQPDLYLVACRRSRRWNSYVAYNIKRYGDVRGTHTSGCFNPDWPERVKERLRRISYGVTTATNAAHARGASAAPPCAPLHKPWLPPRVEATTARDPEPHPQL